MKKVEQCFKDFNKAFLNTFPYFSITTEHDALKIENRFWEQFCL